MHAREGETPNVVAKHVMPCSLAFGCTENSGVMGNRYFTNFEVMFEIRFLFYNFPK